MELFQGIDYVALAIASLTTIVLISALTFVFPKFFVPTYRKKILTLITALLVTVASVEFNWIEWQTTLSGWLLTFGVSVLVYQYLGIEWVKKFLEKKFNA